MQFRFSFLVFSVSNFTIEITCYVEQCTRCVTRCETSKFGVELFLLLTRCDVGPYTLIIVSMELLDMRNWITAILSDTDQ